MLFEKAEASVLLPLGITLLSNRPLFMSVIVRVLLPLGITLLSNPTTSTL